MTARPAPDARSRASKSLKDHVPAIVNANNRRHLGTLLSVMTFGQARAADRIHAAELLLERAAAISSSERFERELVWPSVAAVLEPSYTEPSKGRCG